MSLESDLNKIESIKTDVYNAISDQNVHIPDNAPFDQYPDAVDAISGNGECCILKVNPTPVDSTVNFSVRNVPVSNFQNQAASLKDDTIDVSVSHTGYKTTNTSILMPSSKSINIELADLPYQITFSTTGILVLTSDGDLYGSAYLNPNAKSGNPVAKFEKIDTGVVEISCSQYTGLYRDRNGDVYLGGYDANNYFTAWHKVGSNAIKLNRPTSYTGVCAYIDDGNDLYIYGGGSFGQQGQSSILSSFTKKASNAKDFYSGACSSFLITINDDLYMCGYNRAQGSGSSSSGNVYDLTKRAENVKVACPSGAHSFYISKDDELWGTCAYMCPDGSSTSYTFQKWAENVRSACNVGTSNTSAPNAVCYVTNDNELYGKALNQSYGVLGNGTTGRVNNFMLLASDCAEHIILQNTGFYLSTDGKLYETGLNTYGLSKNETYFTQIASNIDKLYQNGVYNVIYLTDDGYYGIYFNNNGQLGLGNYTNPISTFTKLDLKGESI